MIYESDQPSASICRALAIIVSFESTVQAITGNVNLHSDNNIDILMYLISGTTVVMEIDDSSNKINTI